MQDQPKIIPQRSSSFFSDGRSVRPQVRGTVARGQLHEDSYFYTGMVGTGADAKPGELMPFPVTAAVIERGQERYNIYCTPCHSRVGNGAGMIVQRGHYPAANFHSARLIDAPLGHFFSVMTNGYGTMPNYSAELTPQDRWAIAAYIRALQLSQNAKPSDVGPGKPIARLQDLAVQEGFPANFATQWIEPSGTTNFATIHTNPTMTNATMTNPVMTNPAATTATPTTVKSASTTTAPTTEVKPAVAKPVADAAAGKVIYMSNCQPCHQATRAGMPPMIPSLIGIVKKVGPDHIKSVVSNGIPTGAIAMPAFSALSDADLNNLIAYLDSSK